jgi:hypothetical protein
LHRRSTVADEAGDSAYDVIVLSVGLTAVLLHGEGLVGRVPRWRVAALEQIGSMARTATSASGSTASETALH